MQIAIGQCANIVSGFSGFTVQQRIFSQNIIFTYKNNRTSREDYENPHILRIATTLSSFRISIEPRDMKYKDVRISPRCVMISPGGACVVLNFIEKVRRQPSLASVKRKTIDLPRRRQSIKPLKARQFFSSWLFKWRQISAWRHSGKPFRTIFISIPLEETKSFVWMSMEGSITLCNSMHDWNNLLIVAEVDSVPDGSEWILSLGAFEFDNEPCPSTVFGWSHWHYRKYSRTSRLKTDKSVERERWELIYIKRHQAHAVMFSFEIISCAFSHPINMIQMEKIFSEFVLGLT